MLADLRKSGIDVLGDIPWGSHFCQFYEIEQDMLELLVPFFKAGLENNEFCLWVIAKPLTKEECIKALQHQIHNIEQHLQQGHCQPHHRFPHWRQQEYTGCPDYQISCCTYQPEGCRTYTLRYYP